MIKLELGAGPDRQTPGYLHNDVNPFEGIDYVGEAYHLDCPDASFEEIIAISFVEHLTYEKARLLFANVKRMLTPDGVFLFDVPDLAVWCRYFITPDAPFDQAYVLRTLYGWQRWSGDEHQSGWTESLLHQYLTDAKFEDIAITTLPTEFLARDIYRYRFTRPQDDAHFYVAAK